MSQGSGFAGVVVLEDRVAEREEKLEGLQSQMLGMYVASGQRPEVSGLGELLISALALV